ncbi:MAG: hypothetical protein ACOZQL_27845 [Myxococcota bacterium]
MAFPVGAAVAVVVIALRALSAASDNKGGPPSGTGAAPPVSRGTTGFWQDSGAAGTIIYQLILFGLAFGLTAGGLEAGNGVLLTFGVASAWLLFPAWVARTLFAPLGFVRLAYFSAWLSRIEWRRDKPGGPALIAAWALAQQERPWPSSIAWVEQRLTTTRRALQGSNVVAWGLLEAAKGKPESAREWLESVLMFDPRVAPEPVRRVAAEWLATDAAARGDWQRVKRITTDRKWPATRTLTLLDALASRLLGEPVPTNAGLWLWWLFAPRRLWTWSFVRQVRARAATPPAAAQALPPAPEALEPPGRALFLTAALRRSPQPDARAIVDVARAWERALDQDLRSKLFARTVLIGGGEPDEAVAEVRALVEQALAPLLPAKLEGLSGPLPTLIEAAAMGRKDRLFADLEEKMNRMDQRKLDARELPVLEEWREIVSLKRLYRETLEAGGSADAALAFSVIRDKFVNFGVWLYNVRGEKPLANAIFRMLEAEAVALGDTESERLNKKNAACDL